MLEGSGNRVPQGWVSSELGLHKGMSDVSHTKSSSFVPGAQLQSGGMCCAGAVPGVSQKQGCPLLQVCGTFLCRPSELTCPLGEDRYWCGPHSRPCRGVLGHSGGEKQQNLSPHGHNDCVGCSVLPTEEGGPHSGLSVSVNVGFDGHTSLSSLWFSLSPT